MSHTEILIDFVLDLNEEQAEKLVNYLPKLIALCEEESLPCPPEHSERTQ